MVKTLIVLLFFFFKQKTAYEMRISDWSSDVCSSDLVDRLKSATLSEQDRSVRYNILAREADTNRTLYDGLLQRYKEVSAAAGITASNVSVVDEAAVPIDPSSPDLLLNLEIGRAHV